MADRFEIFDVTVTARTAKASAVETGTSFFDGLVTGVEIVIPDGHAGLTGIRLLQAHQQIIPRTFGAFITGNDEVVRWPISNVINNGAWSVQCYNTDIFDHMFHVRYLIDENGLPSAARVPVATSPLVVGLAYPGPTL